MSDKTESQLIREVAERYLKEEIGQKLDVAWWKHPLNAGSLVTPREHAHIIQLAEGKLDGYQLLQYRVKLFEEVCGRSWSQNNGERTGIWVCVTATTTQRATALLALVKKEE